MQIIFNYDEKEITFELENKNIIFSPQDRKCKELLNYLKNGFNGENKKFLCNGLLIGKNEYNVIYLDEDTDFTDEFSFSKNNDLRCLIYDSIMSKINTDKIVNELNETLNQIDTKVNKYISTKINKNSEFGSLTFDINISSINDIINKYTDIYLNNLTIKSEYLSKREKRLVLYDFIIAKAKLNDNSVIIINNFDAYLKINDVINILHKLEKLDCIIILSSINNIYEYINDRWNVYKYKDGLVEIKDLNSVFIKAYSKYTNIDDEGLISKEDIKEVSKLFDINRHNIGKILINDKLELVIKKPNIIKEDFIICNDELLYYLIKEMCEKFLTEITST